MVNVGLTPIVQSSIKWCAASHIVVVEIIILIIKLLKYMHKLSCYAFLERLARSHAYCLQMRTALSLVQPKGERQKASQTLHLEIEHV